MRSRSRVAKSLEARNLKKPVATGAGIRDGQTLTAVASPAACPHRDGGLEDCLNHEL